MPDTGEDREIKQRVNAKEAVRVSQSKKLLQKSKKDEPYLKQISWFWAWAFAPRCPSPSKLVWRSNEGSPSTSIWKPARLASSQPAMSPGGPIHIPGNE